MPQYLLNIIVQHQIDNKIKDIITSITTASALKKSSNNEKSFDCKLSICISDEEGVFNLGSLIYYLIYF